MEALALAVLWGFGGAPVRLSGGSALRSSAIAFTEGPPAAGSAGGSDAGGSIGTTVIALAVEGVAAGVSAARTASPAGVVAGASLDVESDRITSITAIEPTR